ncbi:hypothetical protein [Enterococcus faecium]|uniref:hypothetical protein n=1 Tax=Enterococcus faecium TaxID=1352 RepID=UPI002158864E|nr:hypothetical protein [Enterococcus faecium]
MMDKSNEEQTTLYTKYWRRLEEVFDNSKGMEDFFRYYLAAITGEYSAKHILYQAFKDYWHKERDVSSDAELLQKLVRYAGYFARLYYNKPEVLRSIERFPKYGKYDACTFCFGII